jgi:dihydrodiol dehydrogenase / D-xylose 1-dehydrogenase (NADP)
MIGEVVSVLSDFCFNASDNDPYPESFFYNRKLGGGASLLVGPYPMAAATLFFPNNKPDCIKVVGQIDAATGVDLQATVAMSFPAIPGAAVAPAVDESNTEENTPKLPGAGMASLTYGFLGENAETTTVVGTKGRLTILPPAHCPTKLVVTLKGQGRGQAAGVYEYEYPLPVDDCEIIAKTGGYFYPNSAGFCYEAAAVARCIAKGLKEAPQYTLAETMIEMEILDQVRSQLGTKSVNDD